MSKWVLSAKRADFEEIARQFGISPVLARIIRNRDVITEEEINLYLNGKLSDLHDGRSMTDMVKACSLIQQYISEGKRFRIIGDYDADGICATYILLRGLRACGADVDYAIPHRIVDGYGLNESLIDRAHTEEREVIVTCDNGIAAFDAINHAYELGMHVIVTDHHEIPFEMTEDGERIEILPSAEAVVNPHREGDNYPYSGICGAVVAWKLIDVLLPMCSIDESTAENLMLELIEEAAIATVGDIMELRDENRIIVREGLRRLTGTSNVGLAALINAVGLAEKQITAYHIGFVIAPCLNASGRLDTAARALELINCDNPITAAQMANELKELNETRKRMTEQGTAIAMDDVENSSLGNDKVLVIYLPDIHESLAGIIAGRIREKFEKPTIVMTDAEEGIKGSGRSIDCYDMHKELTRHKELITKFGGHKMAAGLSMSLENLEAFRRALNETCGLTDDDLVTKTVIDVALPMSYVSYDFIEEISKLEPFGNGNPKPVFAQKGLSIKRARAVGQLKNLLLLDAEDENGRHFELKLFNKTDIFMDAVDEFYGNGTAGELADGYSEGMSPVLIDAIYYPGINSFRGVSSMEFIVNDYRFKES